MRFVYEPPPEDRLGRVAWGRRAAREAARRGHAEDSRARLADMIGRRLRTTFIGAVAALEDEFGDLWGGRKPPGARTPREEALDAARGRLRTRILDLGNAQIRAARQDLDQFHISWEGDDR